MKKTSKTFAELSGKTGFSKNNAPAPSPEVVIPAELTRILSDVGQVLNSAITTQDAKEVLGEPWLTQLKDIHGQLNASIKGMALTEQVPAAQEAFYMLGHVKSQFLYLQNTIQNLLGAIKAKNSETALATASFTEKVNDAIKSKTESGELVSKDRVTDLVTQARKEGVIEGLNQGKLRNDRVLALASAKLPGEVSATIPEALLLGEEAPFNAAKDVAVDRVSKLAGVGLTTASMKSLPWEKQEVFDAQLATFTEIHSNSKQGQSNNSAAPRVSVLAGGGAPQTETAPAAKPADKPILC